MKFSTTLASTTQPKSKFDTTARDHSQPVSLSFSEYICIIIFIYRFQFTETTRRTKKNRKNSENATHRAPLRAVTGLGAAHPVHGAPHNEIGRRLASLYLEDRGARASVLSSSPSIAQGRRSGDGEPRGGETRLTIECPSSADSVGYRYSAHARSSIGSRSFSPLKKKKN